MLDTGQVGCEPCDKAVFIQLYKTSMISSSNDAHKRGSCCVNSHHYVCQTLMEEYKKKCEEDNASCEE